MGISILGIGKSNQGKKETNQSQNPNGKSHNFELNGWSLLNVLTRGEFGKVQLARWLKLRSKINVAFERSAEQQLHD